MYLISFLYKSISILKTFYWRLKSNVDIGQGTILDFSSRIFVHKNSKLTIGDNCYLKALETAHQTGIPFKATICCAKGASVTIGKNTRTAAYISSHKSIKIGEGCLLAGGVNIMDSNGIKLNSLKRYDWKRDTPEDIEIGNNVWICINSTILKGTKIGNNCVVSANSVVKGVYPDNVLIQGNPAVVVSKIEYNND